jgi:hypothetical protein
MKLTRDGLVKNQLGIAPLRCGRKHSYYVLACDYGVACRRSQGWPLRLSSFAESPIAEDFEKPSLEQREFAYFTIDCSLRRGFEDPLVWLIAGRAAVAG